MKNSLKNFLFLSLLLSGQIFYAGGMGLGKCPTITNVIAGLLTTTEAAGLMAHYTDFVGRQNH